MGPPLSILILYNATQTYTNAVWEHLASFAAYSRHRVFFAHVAPGAGIDLDLDRFDAVVVHYSIRLPYNQLPEPWIAALRTYGGVKAVFQQDEYDCTETLRLGLEAVDADLMFTCVPQAHVCEIYDPVRFPRVRFLSTLTGYVPLGLKTLPPPLPLAQRSVMIGYRGRPLPYWYGGLGQEKIEIARRMRPLCQARGLPVDIEWKEEARIYGDGWYDFLRHCWAVLGTESGSNLFDEDGSIRAAVSDALRKDRRLTYAEAERRFFPGRDRPGLMNQVSPRIFEAIVLRVALILFEGEYSGVVRPGEHYIALKKDFSNVDAVLDNLRDDAAVEAMTERAYRHAIGSGSYGYARFAESIDAALEEAEARGRAAAPLAAGTPVREVRGAVGGRTAITTQPLRAAPPTKRQLLMDRWLVHLSSYWRILPEGFRERLKPAVRGLVRRLGGL